MDKKKQVFDIVKTAITNRELSSLYHYDVIRVNIRSLIRVYMNTVGTTQKGALMPANERIFSYLKQLGIKYEHQEIFVTKDIARCFDKFCDSSHFWAPFLEFLLPAYISKPIQIGVGHFARPFGGIKTPLNEFRHFFNYPVKRGAPTLNERLMNDVMHKLGFSNPRMAMFTLGSSATLWLIKKKVNANKPSIKGGKTENLIEEEEKSSDEQPIVPYTGGALARFNVDFNFSSYPQTGLYLVRCNHDQCPHFEILTPRQASNKVFRTADGNTFWVCPYTRRYENCVVNYFHYLL